jgi:phasin family protein
MAKTAPDNATHPTNPFSTVMSHAKQAADEMNRMLQTMKMPPVPATNELMEAYKRNLEAMSAANRIALEGAQTVARRHMEIVQQTMAELSENLRAMAGIEAPGEKAAKQTELLKQAFEHAVSNTKELADMIQHANTEAVGLLNKRFAEAMDEAKTLIEQKKK